MVARLGGDEFAVALRVDQDTIPTAVAERIGAALNQPIEVGGRLVGAGCSIGVVLSDASDEERTTDSLLGRADVAMYVAKSQGKGRYLLYGSGDPRATGDASAPFAAANN